MEMSDGVNTLSARQLIVNIVLMLCIYQESHSLL